MTKLGEKKGNETGWLEQPSGLPNELKRTSERQHPWHIFLNFSFLALLHFVISYEVVRAPERRHLFQDSEKSTFSSLSNPAYTQRQPSVKKINFKSLCLLLLKRLLKNLFLKLVFCSTLVGLWFGFKRGCVVYECFSSSFFLETNSNGEKIHIFLIFGRVWSPLWIN